MLDLNLRYPEDKKSFKILKNKCKISRECFYWFNINLGMSHADECSLLRIYCIAFKYL